jgi:hypothetical protein
LIERVVRNDEVVGLIPICSTIFRFMLDTGPNHGSLPRSFGVMKTYRFALALFVLPLVSPAQTSSPAVTAETTGKPAEASWNDIKNFNYEQRDQFMAGLDLLQKRLELQIASLKAKREKLPATEDPGEFDRELNVLATARTRFLSSSTDLGKATSDNWSQLKDRVGAAWENVQEAYHKTAGDTL